MISNLQMTSSALPLVHLPRSPFTAAGTQESCVLLSTSGASSPFASGCVDPRPHAGRKHCVGWGDEAVQPFLHSSHPLH